MDWQWIVPVIFFVLWVVGQIVKAREEEAKPIQKPAGQRGGTELDRFLEEIERLRSEKATKPVEPVTPVEADVPEVRPIIIRPQRPVVSRATPKPKLVVQRPEPTEALRSTSRIGALAPIIPILTPAPNQGRGPLPAMMALLRNRKSIATAVVLHEVLGPPKCRRNGLV